MIRPLFPWVASVHSVHKVLCRLTVSFYWRLKSQSDLTWSGSFFLKHNKSFRWHLGDYEKHNFFPFEGLWEEKLWFLCVFTGVWSARRACVARRGHVRSVHSAYINWFLTGILPTRKNTQKSKFFLSQAFKWKKNMFFVIPEMPSKTFVMV